MIEHEQTQKTVFVEAYQRKLLEKEEEKVRSKKQGELSAEREKLDTHTLSPSWWEVLTLVKAQVDRIYLTPKTITFLPFNHILQAMKNKRRTHTHAKNTTISNHNLEKKRE